tara:strand:+ start:1065 stop:2828 length:1764 start_codon:yes stop_codon:yes gene_type:complete
MIDNIFMFIKKTKNKLNRSIFDIFTLFKEFALLNLIHYPTKFKDIFFFKSLVLTIFNKISFIFNYQSIAKKEFLRTFPVSLKGNIFQNPLYFGKDKSDFFIRIHTDSRRYSITNNVDDLQNLSLEIIKGEKKISSFVLKNEDESLIPISGEKVKITELNKINQKTIIYETKNKFSYFFGAKDSIIELDSKKDFIIGNPLLLKQKKETKNDLVILLFIDGLVDYEILGFKSLSEIMPNTHNFFDVGYEFKNNFANSEWTMPSFANIFTGLYTQKHGLFHPWSKKGLPKDIDTIAELFSKNGYLTFQSGGNRMINPSFGYSRGFDRNLYQREMNAIQTIENFIENQNTFSERSTFSFLKLLDLHHDLGYLNHISNTEENSKIGKEDIEYSKIKSVFKKYDQKRKNIYIKKLKSLDIRLGLLYSYLNSLKGKNITFILCSDHGQSFLNNDSFLLSSKRTKVPFFYKSNTHKSLTKVYEFTENVDIFSTILFDSDIKINKKYIDSNLPSILSGQVKRNFSFSQSIYPQQTYKAAFRSKDKEMFLETKRKTDNNGICFIGNRNDYDLVLNGEKYNGDLPREYEFFLKSILEN